MSERPKQSKPYAVGYGKPPVHTRFPPGRSRNLKGRPKGRKGPLAMLDDILDRKVTFSDGRSRRRVSLLEAGLLSSAAKAARGDINAMKFLTDLMAQAQALEPVSDFGEIGADDLAIIRAFGKELQERSPGEVPDADFAPSTETRGEET